ncbi:MAG: glycosyltransferase family 39 protein [Chloroflexota bacterium]
MTAGLRLGAAVEVERSRSSTSSLTATWAVCALVAVATILVLTVNLDRPTDISDEGIRGLQLRMTAAGFRPVSEVYSSQGPLSIVLFYPAYRLLGQDLHAARLGVVLWALLALGSLGWVSFRTAGRVAAVASVVALVLSPVFFENARLAFVEVPSIAPTLVALALVFEHRVRARSWHLPASAALLAVGVLAKPAAIVAGAPIALAIIADRARFRALAVYAGTALLVIAVVVLLTGTAALWDQIVGYRLGARAARGWDLGANLALIRSELARDGYALIAIAAAGACLAARRHAAVALGWGVWFGTGAVLLLGHAPLWPKHVTYLLPPLALLAGEAAAGLTRGAVSWRGLHRSWLGVGAAAGVCTITTGYILVEAVYGVPDELRTATRFGAADVERFAADRRLIAAATAPTDYVVIDDAYLAYETGRPTPPSLVDLSWNRVLAGALTAESAMRESRRFNAVAMLVQDDHLGRLPEIVAWLDREYVLVRSTIQRRPNRFRRLYLSPSVNLSAVRTAAVDELTPIVLGDAGGVALRGYAVERRDIRAGNRVVLTLDWQALVAQPPERTFRLRLIGSNGRPAQESDWPIGDAEQHPGTWAAGRWQIQTIRVLLDTDVRPGSYRLTVAPGSDSAAIARELELGTIEIRP